MLLSWIGQFLSLQLLQSADNAETCVTRFNHIIDVTILSCIVRISKQLGVFSFFLCQELSRIFLFLSFTGIQYLNGTCTTHYSDFSSRPCVVHVTAELLTAHYDV